MERRLAESLAIGLLVIGLVAVAKLSPIAAAATAGQLYVTPSVVMPQAVNSTFSVLVKVSAMDQFNAWEVQLIYDTRVIDASGISTQGNILQANATGGIGYETRNCVDGSGLGCCLTNACSPIDGAGIADSSFGDTKLVNGSGLLFNVTFKVVSSRPYSPIIIQNDVFSNGGRNAVVHTTTDGSYGTAPDFGKQANPPSMDVLLGKSNTTTITLKSKDGFSGPVSLTAASPGNGLTVVITPSQLSLSANGTASSVLQVQAQNNSIATSYTISLVATSSSLPSDAFLPPLPIAISIHTKPDFNPYATPSLLMTDQMSSNSTTITVASVQGFSGTVYLSVSAPAQTTAHLDKQTLRIPNGGSATATLIITTQSSILPFRDDYIVNVTSGPIFHLVTVSVMPPPSDVSASASPTSATVQAGGSQQVSINVTSLHYFFGTVYLLGSTPSGVQLTFATPSFFLNYSRTVVTKLTITTNTTTASGDRTIALTVVGQFGQTTLPTHTILLTLTVSSPPPQPQPVARVPTFLGLQETAFFSVIGGLAAVLAVVGVLEARRSNRPRASPILEG